MSRWGPRAATIVPVLVLRATWWAASGPLLTMLQLGWADDAMSWRFDGQAGRHRGSATVELANCYLAELQRVRPELEIVHPAALILPEGL